MASRMSMERAKLILDFVVQWNKMDPARRCTSPNAWVGLKLSCNESAAADVIDKARTVISPARWNQAVTEAKRAATSAATDARTAAEAGEHNPATDGQGGARRSPAAQAEHEVRGWLENQVRRSQRIIESVAADRHPSAADRQHQAEAAALITLVGSLLDHLDAEAKQARADDAEDQAEIERQDHGDVDGPFGGG